MTGALGVEEENEGKEGKCKGGCGREAKATGWTQSLRMNGQGCKNRRGGQGRPRAVNTLTCSGIGLFKAHSSPLHYGPFHVCHCRLPSPNTILPRTIHNIIVMERWKPSQKTILYYAFPSNSIIIYSLFFSEWDSFKCVQGGWDRQAVTTLNLEPFQFDSLGGRRPWWRNAWRLHKTNPDKEYTAGRKRSRKK